MSPYVMRRFKLGQLTLILVYIQLEPFTKPMEFLDEIINM